VRFRNGTALLKVEAEIEAEVEKEVAIMDKYLLEGESVIETKGANFVLRLDDHGLPRFRFDGAMGAVGMAGQEAIGGKLYLSNFRLFFDSHSINRFNGSFSIFLPTIVETKDSSRFVTKKLEVTTPSYVFEFVVWGIPKLMESISAAREALSPSQVEALREAAQNAPELCGDGLKIFPPLMDLLSR